MGKSRGRVLDGRRWVRSGARQRNQGEESHREEISAASRTLFKANLNAGFDTLTEVIVQSLRFTQITQ